MTRTLVGQWWNQSWGRMNRRDIWLYRNDDVPLDAPGAWTLRVHDGWTFDRTYNYAHEDRVREDIQKLLDSNDIGEMVRIDL